MYSDTPGLFEQRLRELDLSGFPGELHAQVKRRLQVHYVHYDTHKRYRDSTDSQHRYLGPIQPEKQCAWVAVREKQEPHQRVCSSTVVSRRPVQSSTVPAELKLTYCVQLLLFVS